MTATSRAPRPDLPPRSWCRPARNLDKSTITIAPVVKHDHPHEATDRYVDLYWTPIIGSIAVAVLRWASHQTRPITMSEHQLATAVGAPGTGQVRTALKSLLDAGLATAANDTLHVAITLPTLTSLQANTFGSTFANRHAAELKAPTRQIRSDA